MTWTYDEIKEADAKLDPPCPESHAAADALNAQMVDPSPGATADTPTIEVKKLLMRSLEYGTVKDAGHDASRPAQIRSAALTLIAACEDPEIIVIGTSDPALVATIEQMLAAFVGASILSQKTADALMAMTEARPAPRWVPALTGRDVWIARGQPTEDGAPA